MTVLTFPTNPTLGQRYNAPNQIQYVYDGVKWIVETVTSTSTAVTNSVQDRVAPMFVDGDNQGITFTYNAATNALSASVTAVNGNQLVNGVHELTLESNGNITAPAFTIPNAVGTNGQVLKWPNSGSTLVWAADSSTTNKLVNGLNEFVLGTDGKLTLPGGAGLQSVGVTGANGRQSLASTRTDGSLFLTANSTTAGDVYLMGQQNYIISASNISNGATYKTWTFAQSGNITLPAGGDIVDSNGASVLGGGGGGSISDFGEGFTDSLDDGKITTSKLYNENPNPGLNNQYTLEVTNGGVVVLPDQSIINGATLKTVAGNYAGITAGPQGADEDSWVWVDNDGATIATKYSTDNYQWKFDNTGVLTLPNGGKLGDPYGDGAVNLSGTQNLYAALASYDTNSWAGVADVSYQNGSQIAGGGFFVQTNINSNGAENTWSFGTDGGLVFPDNTTQTTAYTGGNANTGNFTFNADTITNSNGMTLVTDRGSLAIGTNMEYPGIAGHFHIAIDASNAMPPAGDLFLGDDHNYVKLPGSELNPNAEYGVEIGTDDRDNGDSHVWRFGTDGDLAIPPGKTIRDAMTGDDLLDIRVVRQDTAPTASNGTLWFNTLEGRLYIKYSDVWVDAAPLIQPPPDTDIDVNSITFADATIQTTAYPGASNKIVNGDKEVVLNANGDLLSSKDIIATPDGRFIKDCGNDGGTTSMRWTRMPEDTTVELIRAYTGDAENPDDVERAQIAVEWQTDTQTGLSITAFDDGNENKWEFGGDGVLTIPDGGIVGGPVGTNKIDLSWDLSIISGKTININPGSSGVVSDKIWSFDSGGGITLPNAATISAVDIGYRYTSPSNGPGGVTVQQNSLTVGIANTALADAINAAPGTFTIDFNGGLNDVVIAGISGPQGGTNIYTITGTWPANTTGFPITITSDDYVEGGITKLASSDGVRVTAANYRWDFDNSGGLRLPDGSMIYGGLGSMILRPSGGANVDQALTITPTGTAEGNHVHLTAGGGSTELYLGNDNHYVKLVDGGNVEVRTTANSDTAAWQFDTAGGLTLPGNGLIDESTPWTANTPGLIRKRYNGYLGGINGNPTYNELLAEIALANISNSENMSLFDTEVITPVNWPSIPVSTWELSGYFKATHNGIYTFTATADDYYFIEINNVYPTINTPAVITLVQGQVVSYRVLFANTMPSFGYLQLEWKNDTSQTSFTDDFSGLVSTGVNKAVNIEVNRNTWKFGEYGTTAFPNNRLHTKNNLTLRTSGQPASVITITYSSGGWDSVPTTYLTTTGGSGRELYVDVTVDVSGYATGVSVVYPGNGYTNGEIITATSGAASVVFTISILPEKDWTFGTDGSVTFPDSTVQTTAYPGITTVAKTVGTTPLYLGDRTFTTPLVDGDYGPFTLSDIEFTVQVLAGAPIFTITDVLNNATFTRLQVIGTLDSSDLGGEAGESITIDVSELVPTALDLSKTINKLADGTYTLADGAEGQIMYLVKQTGNDGETTLVEVANGRANGLIVTNLAHRPFRLGAINVDIDMLIFTDGAWQATPGDWGP